jgi:predicted DNA-binding protein with PD1-like motif
MDRRTLITLGGGLLAASAAGAAPVLSPGPTPPGYLPRTPVAPPRGLAPGAQVTEFTPTGRVWRVKLSPGDELQSGMTDFAIAHNIRTASFTGIGGFSRAELSAYDPATDLFKSILVNEKCELASMDGLITADAQGRVTFHAHVVLGLLDGSARAGHLNVGMVNPTAEIFVVDLGEGRFETRR